MVTTSTFGPAVSVASTQTTYEDALRQVWRPLDAAGGIREIVRAYT